MSKQNWPRVKEVFHEALRLDVSERDRFLDKACEGDLDLRLEVESLLISLTEAKSFLEQPVFAEPPESSAEWQFEPGRLISHYKIVSPIGTGGMGEVYLAEDQRLRRQVALKILPEQMTANGDRVRRFQREAEAVSALNHPNILTIFEFGADDGVHILASEFVRGETLRMRLGRGPLPLQEALEIAIQIASALRAAHEARVIHRDIKPENVMIRDDGYVKVLDFGLAKLSQTDSSDPDARTRPLVLSQPGMILGTASYMSPEQARAKSTDARSDIFSLGVVLYEMLAGRKPFAGESTSDVIAAIIQTDPEPVSAINPDVPPELDRIILKALHKDKTDRYQTAADLLASLKDIQRQIDLGLDLMRPEPNADIGIFGGLRDSENETEFIEALKTDPEKNESSSVSQNPRSRKLAYIGFGSCLLALTAFLVWWKVVQPSPSDFPDNSTTKVDQSAKLYWGMDEAEQLGFVRERASKVQELIGDEPSELDAITVQSIKAEIDKYVAKKDSLSQTPMEEGLRVIYGRGSQYAPLVIRSYKERSVPPALGLYQAMIESEYHDCLVNSNRGIGLFQFTRRTAAKYGLAAKDYCDVAKQADAAAHYMSDLASDFGSEKSGGTLGLLAFNVGEDGSRDLLRQLRTSGITERSFWAIIRHPDIERELGEDGKRYVLRFFAAAIIGETPEAFGLPTRPLSMLGD